MIDDPVENIDAQIEAIVEQTEDLSIFGGIIIIL
jgi:hypothetical protein